MSRKEGNTAKPTGGRVSLEILDQVPPQNLDAEKGILGSLLLVPEMCDEVAMVVRADDFYADANQKLFRHLMAMHGEGSRIDAVLLKERLKREGDFDRVGGAPYLAEVAQSVPYAANATYYARIVRDKATLRAVIHASTEILRDAYDTTVDPKELVSQSEQKIFAVRDQRVADGVETVHNLLVDALQRIDDRREGRAPGGLPTGLTDLDKITQGLHNSELIVLAGRPAMGKTALALQIAAHASLNAQTPTLFVSLEMDGLDLIDRLLCSLAEVDGHRVRGGYLSADECRTLTETAAPLSKAQLAIDDTPSRTVTEIAACARREKRKRGLGLLVVDYLQLVAPDNPRDVRQEQVAKMSRRLKCLARELAIPVLCVAQLNRQIDQPGQRHRPRLSHLRESGAIEQDADLVIFVHREEAYWTQEEAEAKGIQGVADVIVAKHRKGPTGDVRLTWLDKWTRFESYHEPLGGPPLRQEHFA